MNEQPEQSLARNLAKPAIDAPAGGRRVERVPGAHLKLKLGSQVSLRLPFVDQRYEGKVVGLESFDYIIVQARLPHEALSRLGQNAALVVQMHAGGTLYGFRSEVLARVSQPTPMLVLAFPDMVERLVLRQGERVRVSVPGNVHGSFGDHEVVVLDLAPVGCSFAARTNLKSPLREARPGERVMLNCDLAIGGCGAPLMAPVVLRRVDEEHGRITMGGQFVDLSEDGLRTVNEYVRRMQGLIGEE